MLKDVFKCINKITHAIPGEFNMSIFKDSIRASTTSIMHADNNLLAGTWEFLKLALAASAKTFFDILGYHKEYLRKTPLFIDKYYEILYSYK